MSGQAVLYFIAFFAANIAVASTIGIVAERSMAAWRRMNRMAARH